MTLPDWGNLVLVAGILRDPARESSRAVFWLPESRDREFQYWERIGTVPRLEIKTEHGICMTAVTSIRARQRLGGGLLSKLCAQVHGQGWRGLLDPAHRPAGREVRRSQD